MDYATVLTLSYLMGVGFCFFCGPLAVLLHCARRPYFAATVSAVAIWLGIFWSAHTSSPFCWFGVFPAICGVFVLWRTSKRV